MIEQAGELTDGPVRVAVFRTLADEGGPYAVLRVGLEGAEFVDELTLRPGQQDVLEGIGRLVLLATAPSTRERRGAVRIGLERSEAGRADDV